MLRCLAGIWVLWIDLDGAVLVLNKLAIVNHGLENTAGSMVVVCSCLLLLELALCLLQSAELLLHLKLLGRLLHSLLLHLLVGPSPLHTCLQHVDTDAFLSYIGII